MDKKTLAAMLEQARSEYVGDVILYAAQRKPDRAPHRKKTNLKDEAFEKVLEEGRKLLESRGDG